MNQFLCRPLALLLACILVTSACGSDDNGDGDEAGGDTSQGETDDGDDGQADDAGADAPEDDGGVVAGDGDGTILEVTVCQEEPEPTGEEHLGHVGPAGVDDSLVAPDLIVVPKGNAEEAIAIITDELGFDPAARVIANPAQIVEVLPERYSPQFAVIEGGLIDQFFLVADIIKIDNPDIEVREAVELLRDGFEIDARPVFAMRAEGHWGRAPGVRPTILTEAPGEAVNSDARLFPATEGLPDFGATPPSIGVVDTGFLTIAGPLMSFDEPDAEEVEKEDDACFASHGTFVASVIHQVNPAASIVGAAPSPIAQGTAKEFKRADNSVVGALEPLHEIWDELAVVAAIDNLIMGQAVEAPLDALNLSFATYGHISATALESAYFCTDPEVGPLSASDYIIGSKADVTVAPPVLEIAMLCLAETGPEVFAAGGNWNSPSPVFPAAFPTVVGVGTIETDGDPDVPGIVWEDGVRVDVDRAERWWVDRWELGCHLVGIGTNDPAEVVVWSGSSFATAVASARATVGQDPPVALPDSLIVLPPDAPEQTHC